MSIIVIGAIIVIGVPLVWVILWMAMLAERNQDGERVYSPTLVKARGRKQ